MPIHLEPNPEVVETSNSFSFRNDHRADIVIAGVRYLVVERNARILEYCQALSSAGLPYLSEDSSRSTDKLVYGVITRDVRAIRQVTFGRQPDLGWTASSVINRLGMQLGQLVSFTGLMPDPNCFVLDDVAVLRRESDVMLLPPISLVEGNAMVEDQILGVLDEQLQSRFHAFGAVTLSHNLHTGFENGLA